VLTAEQFDDYISRENAKWTPIVRKANIKAE